MDDIDLIGQVFILIAGLMIGVSERIIAWRWLRVDAHARQARFAPWAVLSLLIPFLGVGLYLLLRPKGRLCACPHCRSPSPADLPACLHCGQAWPDAEARERDCLTWQLPRNAVIPLAAMGAIAMTLLTTGLWFYERLLDVRMATLKTAVGVGFALSIGVIAWLLARTRRTDWQDNPLALLLLMTVLGQTSLLLASIPTLPALVIATLPLSLVVAFTLSAMLHLSLYDVRRAVIGLVLGFVVAVAAHVGVTPAYGFSAGRFLLMALCVAPFMLAVAILSLRARLAGAPGPADRAGFLRLAVPLWGLLGLLLLG